MKPTAIALAIMSLYGGISVPRARFSGAAYIGAGGPFGYGKGVA